MSESNTALRGGVDDDRDLQLRGGVVALRRQLAAQEVVGQVLDRDRPERLQLTARPRLVGEDLGEARQVALRQREQRAAPILGLGFVLGQGELDGGLDAVEGPGELQIALAGAARAGAARRRRACSGPRTRTGRAAPPRRARPATPRSAAASVSAACTASGGAGITALRRSSLCSVIGISFGVGCEVRGGFGLVGRARVAGEGQAERAALGAAVAGEQVLQQVLQLVEERGPLLGPDPMSPDTPIEGRSGRERSSAATSACTSSIRSSR